MISPSNPTVFRPKSNLVTLGVFCFFIAGINISSWYTSQIRTNFELGLITLGLIIISYLVFAKPKVIFFDEGLTIVNPTETFTYGWDKIEEIDTRFTMSVQVADRKISAWAAPGPTRRQASRVFKSDAVNPSDLRGMGIDSGLQIRPSDLAETDSGAAAAIARVKLMEYSRKASPVHIDSEHSKNYRTLIVAIVLTLTGSVLLLLN